MEESKFIAFRRCAALILCGYLWATGVARAAETALGDASIVSAQDGSTWTLAAGGATLVLRAGVAVDFGVQQLVSPSGAIWMLGPAPNTSLTVNGKALLFGSSAAGFSFERASVVKTGAQLRLDVAFNLQPSGLRVIRHYAVTDGSPTFETWSTLERTGRNPVRVANLNGIVTTVPAGKIHWLTGLQGDNADTEHDSAFTLQSRQLAPGEHLNLNAAGRSSEKTVPWLAIDGSQEEFYASLAWSGAWLLTIDASPSSLALSFGLAAMNTLVDTQPVEGPHVLFGVARGGIWKASAALQSYVRRSIRQGRPLQPLVTYNTWFAYGTRIDEDSMRGEMLRSAALGTELFVIDAGWYTGAGGAGIFDYTTGLGTWEPDPERFPNGLAALSDYAHSLGLKFGIWVEPERVNLSTVGQPDLAQESWLVTNGGRYGSDDAALLCLSGTAGRQWLTDRLTQLLDAVQPDYIKWDNNMWVNCDRGGHGHGNKDGNFAQVNGLYSVLETLRERYPNLLIEQVGGGGARLDLGMIRYSDVAWMDDRTAPSVRVRHNVEGLSVLFPPAYLLSFLIESGAEPINGGQDLTLYLRSRMEGVLGLCFKNSALSGDDQAAFQNEIAVYKVARDIQAHAAGTMLTAQAKEINGPAWDVLQETTFDGQKVVVFAFQSDPGVGRTTVKPIGLKAETQYDVQSADVGALGTVSGAELAATGIALSTSSISAAHVLILTARP